MSTVCLDIYFYHPHLAYRFNSFISHAFILLIAFHIPASSKSAIKPVLVTISGSQTRESYDYIDTRETWVDVYL